MTIRVELAELRMALARQQALIESLTQTVTEQRAALNALADSPIDLASDSGAEISQPSPSRVDKQGKRGTSRRGLLRGAAAGAAAAAVAAVAVGGAEQAHAAPEATGGNFILGQSNDAGATTVLIPSASTTPAELLSINNRATAGSTGLGGYGGTSGIGVYGGADTGGAGVSGVSSGAGSVGVIGTSDVGYGVYGRGTTSSGIGVQGYNQSGGRAVSGTALGTGSVGVFGDSDLGTGVSGVAGSGGTGVSGSSGATGTGVRGASVGGGTGVSGTSDTGWGISGISGANGTGVYGYAPGTYSYGVFGYTDVGTAVYGESSSTSAGYGVAGVSTGYVGVMGQGIGVNGVGGLFTGGRAPLSLALAGVAGAPTSGAHDAGDIVLDSVAAMWLCVASGTPGTWVQVAHLAPGATSGGAITYLAKPIRLLDTRGSDPLAKTDGGGPIAGGNPTGPAYPLTISGVSWQSVTVPASAVGAIGNVTAVAGAGGGFLAIVPHGAGYSGTATLAYGPNQVVSNAFNTGLTGGELDILIGGSATDVILDLIAVVA